MLRRVHGGWFLRHRGRGRVEVGAERDASKLVMLRRFPQGLRDRLLMNTVGLRREAFETNGLP
jgi:hypothetical protein